ncbi:MAG: hypothetical protein IJP74_12175 [Prevotella sp.]|nr:hypothetical protein [Prevotella sp.]
MNQVARTFSLVGLVVAIMLAMHLLPTIHIGGQELRHVSVLSDIMPDPYHERFAMDVTPKPAPPKPIRRKRAKDAPADTLDGNPAGMPATADGNTEPTAAAKETDKGIVTIDDYSEGEAGGMDAFYHKLSTIGSLGRPLRIAYYGDSFIEGDILTADLREMLQQRFGGCGVGWVDCGNEINGFRRTVRQKFKGMTEYEVVKKPFSHACEGINQRYFVPEDGAVVWTGGSSFRKHSRQWQRTTLFLRSEGGLSVTTYLNDDSAHTDHIDGSTAVKALVREGEAHNVCYTFGSVTPQTYIYGMALEGDGGIVLDNFSMRGSSGCTLARIPMQTLRHFASIRPYDLIILHYGLNVVSDRSHAANYKAYTRQMRSAINHFREAFPDASVLVVGVPDRDQRTPAGIRTVSGIESLSAYQQIMASDCHVAYYNFFKAMGGRESMSRLVDRNMANKDYTHLSYGGGKHVAAILFKSLMAGYDDYKTTVHND